MRKLRIKKGYDKLFILGFLIKNGGICGIAVINTKKWIQQVKFNFRMKLFEFHFVCM